MIRPSDLQVGGQKPRATIRDTHNLTFEACCPYSSLLCLHKPTCALPTSAEAPWRLPQREEDPEFIYLGSSLFASRMGCWFPRKLKDGGHRFIFLSQNCHRDDIVLLHCHCSPVQPGVRWPPGSPRGVLLSIRWW